MVSILLNIAIAIISVLAWLSVVQGHGDDRNLMAHGLRSLKYYTVLSNLFSGLVSALYAADMLLSQGSPDSWIFVLKLAAASVVMVTFLTVMLFLGPTMGWEYWHPWFSQRPTACSTSAAFCSMDESATAWSTISTAFCAQVRTKPRLLSSSC